MKNKEYIKPVVVVEQIDFKGIIAASGVDAYNQEQGSGEVYVNERRNSWGNFWESD